MTRSVWQDTAAAAHARPPLSGSLDVDVAIVGAGYTGLWTAYYLRASGLDVALIEAEHTGFGASGRNGGWCSALFPAKCTPEMQQALNRTVDEVGRVVAAEGIDCDWAKGGTLSLARTRRQLRSMKAPLTASEASAICSATRVLGGQFSPDCAALHPLKLVHGLARGAQIYEGTRALRLEPGRVITDRGDVRARFVIRATEGYSWPLAPRTVVPIYSLMIATAPLPQSTWDEIGLANRTTFTDHRRLVIYGQRTADGRLAFGGRGAPYHFGSAVDPSHEDEPNVHRRLRETLVDLFPVLGDVQITHRWGGALGIPRDWQPSVGLDEATGLGWAGGYVGDGVAASNLAGRTLADLILGRSTELTRLPWVNRGSRRWEPEPLRWLGINTALRAVSLADRLHP